ncbi:MAG: tRNA (adenosine(37)-N6)-threonylcarbamoyltransferase complex dimerization subunit type 1 TsaB [Thermomicrobiales bacterium]
MPSSAPRLVLAIDTSTEMAGIGLSDGESHAELVWPAGRMQTTSVLAEIDTMLARYGRAIGDVGAVAVAIGPGTFTGLRVGLSIAKGLVLAQGAALIGIPTLAVTAAPWQEAGRPVMTVLPAGRGRVVCAAFGVDGGAGKLQNLAFDAFTELAATSGLMVVGELSHEQRSILADRGVAVASASASIRRPAVLADLALARWDRNDLDDPATLEPLYVHGVRATTLPVEDRLRRRA